MTRFSAFEFCRKFPALIAASLVCLASVPAFAAGDRAEAIKGTTVSVLKASRACFDDIVDVSGIVTAPDETAVRPERPGLKVADVLVDPGDTVTAGQTLARLAPVEGGPPINLQAPVAGLVSASTAVVGAPASPRGEALFNIVARSEYDLIGMVPTADIARLAVGQTATMRIIGAGDMQGTVRRIAPTVEANSQLGQVFIAIAGNRRLFVNGAGRALIKTGQSCGLSVPLTAGLYSGAGTIVQVVRHDRVETRRVAVGLMSGGQVEIKNGLNEGDDVVARAGSLLREGDAVRPVSEAAAATANAK